MAIRKAPAPAQPAIIKLVPIDIRVLHLRLIGDAPLICHAWSTRQKQAMLAKQMQEVLEPNGPKDPERDYRESLYHDPDGGYRFPSVGFKSAAVDACSHVNGITKVEARGAFHINGEHVRIIGEPSPREDMVRLNGTTADIRYRGQFVKWSADIAIRYNASVLSAEQIVHLFNVAGFGIGVGDWRPQKDGSFGLFHVATNEDAA